MLFDPKSSAAHIGAVKGPFWPKKGNEQLTLVFDKYKGHSEKHNLHANTTQELTCIPFRQKFAITIKSAQDLQKCRFCDVLNKGPFW